jgi:MoxR-like ATPase
MSFYINETEQTVTAKQRPIVIITSNAEKELPDAFLRRCIFHYIEFPAADLMEEIVRVHYPDLKENLLKEVMRVFYALRKINDLKKKPSTSELVDWIHALLAGGIPIEKLKDEIPFVGTLLKKEADYTYFSERQLNEKQGWRPNAYRMP